MSLLTDRKRMSVVVEDTQGRIMLLCKGADSTVLSQCVDGDKEKTIEHVDYYAMVRNGAYVLLLKIFVAVFWKSRCVVYYVSYARVDSAWSRNVCNDCGTASGYGRISSDVYCIGTQLVTC